MIGITRRSLQYMPAEDRNLKLRQRLRAPAEERLRSGCPMLDRVIRREDFAAGRASYNPKLAAVVGGRGAGPFGGAHFDSGAAFDADLMRPHPPG